MFNFITKIVDNLEMKPEKIYSAQEYKMELLALLEAKEQQSHLSNYMVIIIDEENQLGGLVNEVLAEEKRNSKVILHFIQPLDLTYHASQLILQATEVIYVVYPGKTRKININRANRTLHELKKEITGFILSYL